MDENLPFILQHICHIEPTKPVLVGVSGGPDSLGLLHWLVENGYTTIAAHFNHHLRAEAGADATLVQSAAAKLGAAFHSGEDDVAEFAASQGLSLEEAARILRYRFLFTCASSLGAQAVAVAHHADDQVETVLMHLLRGAGPSGLRGMQFRSLPNPWSSSIPLVRPLLNTWRTQILDYIARHNLQPAEDASNQDVTFFRNRLRHELLPDLERYNPQIRQVLWRTASVMAEDYEIIESAVQSAWRDCDPREGDGWVAFDRATFAAQLPGVQRGLVRQAIASLVPGLRNISLDVVERTRALAAGDGSLRRTDLAGGLYALRWQDRLWIAARLASLPDGKWPGLPGCRELSLADGSALLLENGWVLHCEVLAAGEGLFERVVENPDPAHAWLDADLLKLPLSVRCRRAGDHMMPLGMGGHSIKLSDLMINLKIPGQTRTGWPLVCAGDEIVWVPACRQAETARLSAATRRAVHLWLAAPGGML